jgi:arginine-tRNA-protein transferase
VTLESDAFTEEKYAVFENYQRIVHEEPPAKISRHGFRRFLCDSPLRRQTWADADGRERKLGSFHQCYRLDGKLVAIGVLDLLPDCVSAVYFFYHESIHSHCPGKLGALREIALAIEGGYRWWYPGYYIHSCPKMRYKIDYAPQYILDPETLTWDLLDSEVLALFDKRHYVSLSQERLGIIHDDLEAENKPATSEDEPGNEAEREDEEGESDEEEAFLLASNMPGISSLEQMMHVDMDNLLLRSDHSTGIFYASDLLVWAGEAIDDAGGVKGRLAELVSAIGPDLMANIIVDFCRLSMS